MSRWTASAACSARRCPARPGVAVEIERKYVLPAVPPADVLAAGTAYDIEQTYLTSSGGARRVRRRSGPDGIRHWLNEKHRVGGISREETEEEVSEEEYRRLLGEADPRSGTVLKTRHVLGHGAQTLEVDV